MEIIYDKESQTLVLIPTQRTLHNKIEAIFNYKGTQLINAIRRVKPEMCLITYKFGYSKPFYYSNKLGFTKKSPKYMFLNTEKFPAENKITNKALLNFIGYDILENYNDWYKINSYQSDLYYQLKEVHIRFFSPEKIRKYKIKNESLREKIQHEKYLTKLQKAKEKRVLQKIEKEKNIKEIERQIKELNEKLQNLKKISPKANRNTK